MKRYAVALVAAILFSAAIRDAVAEPANPAKSSTGPSIYDPNPDHIWNRLYTALCLRPTEAGAFEGVDAIDPLLWRETKYLLAGPSRGSALNVLNEFLRTHAENQIRDPLRRALLQHSLWAVFDWSASERDTYRAERHELQTRLAEVLRRVALTKKEIDSLPQNYAAAVTSGMFAARYDPNSRTRPLLPSDLLPPGGPWVRIKSDFQPIALSHVYACSGRSSFMVFIRLPGGRKATVDYLQTLWNAPDPWIASEIDRGDNPNLPQFPVGTQVALLREMNLFDRNGVLVSSPITEGIQIRVYRTITSRQDQNRVDFDQLIARKEQDFYEVRLSQTQLFAGKAGGLKAVARDAAEIATFQTQGEDAFDSLSGKHAPREAWRFPILDRCAQCHSAPGIHSVQSRIQLLKPYRAQLDPMRGNDHGDWWEYDDTVPWKQQRYDWGLLNGYWQAGRDAH